MPLTSRPGEMAGNIPLILLASDNDGSPGFHPYVRPAFTEAMRPCITSAELAGYLAYGAQRTFAVWLPTPTLTGHSSRRRLFVAYELSIAPANKMVACPQFQVWAASQPSRPGGVETKFSAWPARTRWLSYLTPAGWSNVGAGTRVVEIPNVSAPGDSAPGNGPIDAEAMCFLTVRMPRKGDYYVESIVFRLLGVAVEQW